ncbi:hypothetical protein GCM10010413_40710 [Promicromonospora sukumoe]|uniref:Tetratricopeptide (TPR) repeat protein n=1 Tax=Promicromonospora sukumoe TaxID=88382 RepID=A0A7W3JE67_9MICO|nr:hypothetical protein [Promicromonospora sukumoe]MBA8811222.1 tetratricopeptide (TPR) repeat protein [Promicromonospora sukumoe]
MSQNIPVLPSKLVKALASIPSTASSDYHAAAAVVSESLIGSEVASLEAFMESDRGSSQGFNILYVLLARHRRHLDPSLYRKTFDRFAHRYSDEPMSALLASDLAMLDAAGPDLARAIQHAQTAMDAYPFNSSLVVHHARLLAEFGFSGGEVASEELQSTLERVDRAIESAPDVPRNRAVRAQYAALLGEFDAAQKSIQRAIDLEDSTSQVYPIRVIEYQRIRADIALRKEVAAIRERSDEYAEKWSEEMSDRLNEEGSSIRKEYAAEIGKLRSESLASLGLLAAVIAFIVTTVQISQQFEVEGALRLLAGTAGMVALVFAAFGAAFGVTGPRRLVLPIVLGVVLFVLGWFL